MLFSLNYHSKYKTMADEIRCPYNQLGSIFDFIKQYPDKRYLISIDKGEEELSRAIEQINFVKEVAKDYTVACGNVKTHLGLLKDGYNSFLRFPVVDWETFHALSSIGASDIYIDGSLGFSSEALAAEKKENNKLMIRVSPTISPNTAIRGRSPSTFFIRPEDLNMYPSIDIIDFKIDNQDVEDSLFTIYKRGTFNFAIGDLIKGLPNINNQLFNSGFANNRLNCRQVCKIPGRVCHACDSYFAILGKASQLLSKKQ